jgi:hypothetical protein
MASVAFAPTCERSPSASEQRIASSADPTTKSLRYQARSGPAAAKPQTFITADGWFTYNLVTGLAQL